MLYWIVLKHRSTIVLDTAEKIIQTHHTDFYIYSVLFVWLYQYFLQNKTPLSFFTIKERGTDGSQASENWAILMEVCDIINETDEGYVYYILCSTVWQYALMIIYKTDIKSKSKFDPSIPFVCQDWNTRVYVINCGII